MRRVTLNIFKLHEKNDKRKGKIKAVLDNKFYRKVLKKIRTQLKMKNRDIAKKIGVGYFSFIKSFQNSQVPLESLRKLILLYNKITKHSKKETERDFLKKIRKLVCNSGKTLSSVNCVITLSETLCKIGGAISADGTLHLDKNKRGYGYLIEVSDFYKDNLELFCRWIKKEFGIGIVLKKKGNYYEVRLKNKIIFRYLNKILGIPAGKKSKIVMIPNLIRKSGLKYQKAFVSGLLLFDGGIDFKNGYYQFSTQSFRLLKDVKRVLTRFEIVPDYTSQNPDKKGVYRLIVRKKSKLQRLLSLFIEKNTTKYEQLKLHVYGFEKLTNIKEVLRKIDNLYPRIGQALTFRDLILLSLERKSLKASDVSKEIHKSKDVIKKSLNKLESWNILVSNKSKGKINKVWMLNPILAKRR